MSISREVPRPTSPSLADTAYYAIRGLIVSLALPPRTLIDERALVERLKIGRTPVREALQRLAQERLIEVYPRRGMFVTDVDVRALTRLSEVRVVLESEAARLAAERATQRERESLKSLLDEFDFDKRSQHELMELDERIHRAVYRLAHNPFLEATLEQYYAHVLRIWYVGLEQAKELENAVEDHRALLEAIRDRDPERAAETMRTHVLGFEQAMRRILIAV